MSGPRTVKALHNPADAGLGVYVHWPFCLSICPYCAFNVQVFRNVGQAEWRAAYAAEINHLGRLADASGPVTSVFFGGGTPSLIDPDILEAVLEEIAAVWGMAPDAEITLEANPVGLDRPKLQDLKKAGISRLSLGVQSLDDAALKFLGRNHSARDAITTFERVRGVFERASLDLIYARPGQTVSSWAAELSSALALQPDHLSAYQLTVEPGTAFGKLHQAGKLELPAEDVQVALYEKTEELCREAGLAAYEVSNHAREGHACRHNVQCWQGAPYVGVGPGAHGRVGVQGIRHATLGIKSPSEWLSAVSDRGHGMAGLEPLTDAEVFEERLMFGLRLVAGVSLDGLPNPDSATAGKTVNSGKMSFLIDAGLLGRRENRLYATRDGRLVLDRLVAELLTE